MATDVEAMLKQRRFNETETGNVRNRQRNGRQELFQYPVKCNRKSKNFSAAIGIKPQYEQRLSSKNTQTGKISSEQNSFTTRIE